MGDEFQAMNLLGSPEKESLSPLPLSHSPSNVSIKSSATQQRSAFCKEFIEDKYNYIAELKDNNKTYNPLHAARHQRDDFKRKGTIFTGNKIHKLDIRVTDMRRCEVLEDIKGRSPKSLETISDIYVKSKSVSPSIIEKDAESVSFAVPSVTINNNRSETILSASAESIVSSNLVKYKMALPKMTFVSNEMHLVVKELEHQTDNLNTKILEQMETCQSVIANCRRIREMDSSAQSLKSPMHSMNQIYPDMQSSIDSLSFDLQNKWYNNVNDKEFREIKSADFMQQLMFWKYQLNEVNACTLTQTDEANNLVDDVVYFKEVLDDLAVVIYDLYGAMINQLEYLFQYAINYSSSEPIMDVVLSFVEFFIPIVGFMLQITYMVFKFFNVKFKSLKGSNKAANDK